SPRSARESPSNYLCASIFRSSPESTSRDRVPVFAGTRLAGFGVDHPNELSCTASRPISTRFEPVPRLRSFTTGSCRIPSDLARRTQPVWQYQAIPALSALLPTLPGVSRIRLRSAFYQAAATTQREGIPPPS